MYLYNEKTQFNLDHFRRRYTAFISFMLRHCILCTNRQCRTARNGRFGKHYEGKITTPRCSNKIAAPRLSKGQVVFIAIWMWRISWEYLLCVKFMRQNCPRKESETTVGEFWECCTRLALNVKGENRRGKGKNPVTTRRQENSRLTKYENNKNV